MIRVGPQVGGKNAVVVPAIAPSVVCLETIKGSGKAPVGPPGEIVVGEGVPGRKLPGEGGIAGGTSLGHVFGFFREGIAVVQVPVKPQTAFEAVNDGNHVPGNPRLGTDPFVSVSVSKDVLDRSVHLRSVFIPHPAGIEQGPVFFLELFGEFHGVSDLSCGQ